MIGENEALCFENGADEKECVYDNSDLGCSFSGTISTQDKHIAYLEINNSSINGYNKEGVSLGTITSTCEMDGKVGFIGSSEGFTAVRGIDNRIEFWDSYIYGDYGKITFLKKITAENRSNGYIYEHQSSHDRLSDGFMNITEVNNHTYAIYSSKISKTTCENLISNTGWYLGDNNSSYEINLFNSLSPTNSIIDISYIDDKNKYCLIEISKALGFETEIVAVKSIVSTGSLSMKCSPYICKNHKCGIAVCQKGYTGILQKDKNIISDNTLCKNSSCDYTQPYTQMCGGGEGFCNTQIPTIFESTDGGCYEVSCANNLDELNLEDQTCLSYECIGGTSENSKGECVK